MIIKCLSQNPRCKKACAWSHGINPDHLGIHDEEVIDVIRQDGAINTTCYQTPTGEPMNVRVIGLEE